MRKETIIRSRFSRFQRFYAARKSAGVRLSRLFLFDAPRTSGQRCAFPSIYARGAMATGYLRGTTHRELFSLAPYRRACVLRTRKRARVCTVRDFFHCARGNPRAFSHNFPARSLPLARAPYECASVEPPRVTCVAVYATHARVRTKEFQPVERKGSAAGRRERGRGCRSVG